MNDSIFDYIKDHWHRAEERKPAIPSIPAAPTGGHVKLSQLAHDAADSFAQGKAWLDQAADSKFPALLAEVARLQASPIVQALEGVTLGPDAETHIAGIITAIGAHAQEQRQQRQSPMANPEAAPDAEQPVA